MTVLCELGDMLVSNTTFDTYALLFAAVELVIIKGEKAKFVCWLASNKFFFYSQVYLNIKVWIYPHKKRLLLCYKFLYARALQAFFRNNIILSVFPENKYGE